MLVTTFRQLNTRVLVYKNKGSLAWVIAAQDKATHTQPCLVWKKQIDEQLGLALRAFVHKQDGVQKNGSKMGRDAPRGGQQAACHTLLHRTVTPQVTWCALSC